MLVSPMGTLSNSEITADNAQVTSATSTMVTCHFAHSRPCPTGTPSEHAVGSRRASKLLPGALLYSCYVSPLGTLARTDGGVLSSLKLRNGSTTGLSDMVPPHLKKSASQKPDRVRNTLLYFTCAVPCSSPG